MTTRTNNKTVTFNRRFALNRADETLPAGTYTVETDEELIEGVSFLAYRRISTRLHLGRKPGSRILDSVITIDPKELDAALARDRAPEVIRSEPNLDQMLADPVVRLMMRSDALSEDDVRRTLLRRLTPLGPSSRISA